MAHPPEVKTPETGFWDRLRQAASGPSAGTWFASLALASVVTFSAGSWLASFSRPVAPMTFSDSETKSESADGNAGQSVMVHVVGAVKSPGVVRLKVGDRVADAITAAGGAWTNAATDALNLAAKVEDGEKIIVPKRGTVAVSPDSGSRSPTSSPKTLAHRRGGTPKFDDGIPVVPPGVMELTPLPTPKPDGNATAAVRNPASASTAPVEAGGMVSLNSATQSQLETLPGIGPKTAQAILEYRKQNGPFANVDDIINVKGIGPKKLEKMRPFLRL